MQTKFKRSLMQTGRVSDIEDELVYREAGIYVNLFTLNYFAKS